MAGIQATPPVLAFPQISVEPFLGPLLIGLVISSCLLGLTTLQTYFYFLNYGKDRLPYKVLVATLWILDVLATIFISHSAYYYMVHAYGNKLALLFGEWSLIAEVLLTIVIAVLVQMFYAFRVLGVTRYNYFLAGLVFLTSTGTLATGIVAVVKLYQIKTFLRLPEALRHIIATLALAAANDILITVILCTYLLKTKTSFKETKSTIRTLMIYTIETGLLTSMVALADLIAIVTMSDNWIFIAISLIMPKLYTNSLLTVLNSRKSLRMKEGTSNMLSGGGTLQSILVTTVRTQEVSPKDDDIQLSAVSSKPEYSFKQSTTNRF